MIPEWSVDLCWLYFLFSILSAIYSFYFLHLSIHLNYWGNATNGFLKSNAMENFQFLFYPASSGIQYLRHSPWELPSFGHSDIQPLVALPPQKPLSLLMVLCQWFTMWWSSKIHFYVLFVNFMCFYPYPRSNHLFPADISSLNLFLSFSLIPLSICHLHLA